MKDLMFEYEQYQDTTVEEVEVERRGHGLDVCHDSFFAMQQLRLGDIFKSVLHY